jgi:catalase (peroxidase I)
VEPAVVVTLNNVQRKFGDVVALDALSMNVSAGSVTVLAGPPIARAAAPATSTATPADPGRSPAVTERTAGRSATLVAPCDPHVLGSAGGWGRSAA